MKKPTDKAKIYEIVYKAVQTTLYLGIVGVGIAYIIFLSIGQDKRIFFNVEVTLMFGVLLLWQADILIRKKLYKSNKALGKSDKKHTVAVCVALVGGTILAVSFALMSFCNMTGVFTFAMGIVVLLAIIATSGALTVEHSISREIKAEKADEEKSISEADENEITKGSDKINNKNKHI